MHRSLHSPRPGGSGSSSRASARRPVDPLRFFSAEQVERARAYHRPLYWSVAAEVALATGLLAVLTWSAAGGVLDPRSLPWWARTLAYGSIIIVLSTALGTPLAFGAATCANTATASRRKRGAAGRSTD